MALRRSRSALGSLLITLCASSNWVFTTTLKNTGHYKSPFLKQGAELFSNLPHVKSSNVAELGLNAVWLTRPSTLKHHTLSVTFKQSPSVLPFRVSWRGADILLVVPTFQLIWGSTWANIIFFNRYVFIVTSIWKRYNMAKSWASRYYGLRGCLAEFLSLKLVNV